VRQIDSPYDDHVHEHSWNTDTGKPEPSVGFDYEAVEARLGEVGEIDAALDRNETIGYGDALAAISVILQWCASPDTLTMAGARVQMLILWLHPEECRFKSLGDIAARCNSTKQNLSRALMEFRKRFKLHLNLGKRESTSETYAEAQRESVRRGTHSSQVYFGKRAKS
jgi:hypothetical protein